MQFRKNIGKSLSKRVYDKIHEITIDIKKAILLYRFHKLLLDVFEPHKAKQKQKVPIHNKTKPHGGVTLVTPSARAGIGIMKIKRGWRDF